SWHGNGKPPPVSSPPRVAGFSPPWVGGAGGLSTQEPGPSEPRPVARLRGDDPGTRDLPRLRGDLEGADAPAHASDVGHERDPRDRDRRRDARRGTWAQGH